MKFIKAQKVKEKKTFIPFDLTLRFETPEEARLMYHVLNHRKLRDRLLLDMGYNNYDRGSCSENLGENPDGERVRREIEKYLGENF
jgi:hypothetical protein